MKTVLVTGGTVRLGLAIAQHLRSAGWRVLTSSHRPDAGADLVADLAEPLGPARLYAAALAANNGNPPDALVNNAALFAAPASLLTALNLEAPRKLTTLMAGRETGRGSVVNVLDSRILCGSATDDYARTKLALHDFTRKAAALFAATLNVNAVAPGPVFPIVGVHEPAGETPLGRPTGEDVARAVAFLLTATATSGAILPVDGGQHLL